MITAFEQGMTKRSDEEQLEFALSIGRVIFTSNVKDFSRLHRDFLTLGKNHAGIIAMHQKRYSIGEQVQRLQRLVFTKSAKEMENTLQYLSNIVID